MKELIYFSTYSEQKELEWNLGTSTLTRMPEEDWDLGRVVPSDDWQKLRDSCVVDSARLSIVYSHEVDLN